MRPIVGIIAALHLFNVYGEHARVNLCLLKPKSSNNNDYMSDKNSDNDNNNPEKCQKRDLKSNRIRM